MTYKIRTITFRIRHMITGAIGTGEVTTGIEEQRAHELITDNMLNHNIEVIEFT